MKKVFFYLKQIATFSFLSFWALFAVVLTVLGAALVFGGAIKTCGPNGYEKGGECRYD